MNLKMNRGTSQNRLDLIDLIALIDYFAVYNFFIFIFQMFKNIDYID